MRIHEALSKGAANARTGKELAQLFNCDIREITQQISRERREGYPICASARGQQAGYYLAESPEELATYCKRLYHRGGELFKTRRALINTLNQLIAQKAQQEQEAGHE